MYRIRLHGRGGHGIKTASRILGTAFFLEGWEVQDAPRYGAERRGAPIFAYVRADRQPIYERGVIPTADLVVIADDTLVPVPAAGILQGLSEATVLLINTDESARTWQDRLHVDARIFTLDAVPEARAELSYVGATCAGAAARLVGVIPRATLERAIREELEPLGLAAVAENVGRALAAFDTMAEHAGCVEESGPLPAGRPAAPGWVDLPFETADVSAPAIHAAATSVEVRTGLWRTMRPVIDLDLCNRCTWVCGSFCPDNAITVREDGYPAIDYDHCKGCLICVAVCPTHAIGAEPEREAAAAEAATGEPE